MLDPNGPHGIQHWARVHENGMLIADKLGLDHEVLELFAVFHDSQRKSDGHDPHHGTRGAELARKLRGEFFELDEKKFDQLSKACCFHSLEIRSSNPIIQACWDSDRLDLGRLNISVDEDYLSTSMRFYTALREEAELRGCRQAVMPVLKEWLSEPLPETLEQKGQRSSNALSRPNIIENGTILSEAVVLTHMARGLPHNGWLFPNIVFDQSKHALLKLPRVIVEFCMNGTIIGDPFFSHATTLVVGYFDDFMEENSSNAINVWPTGTTFLGPVELTPKQLVLYDESLADKSSATNENYTSVPFPAEGSTIRSSS